MENIKLYCLIYELKGMVKTMSELSEFDDNIPSSLVENLENKIREITTEIETKSA
jgi:hypothetical protein